MSANIKVLEVPSVISVSRILDPDQNSPSEGNRMSAPYDRVGLFAVSLASSPDPMLAA
jgi:hypothetical protein